MAKSIKKIFAKIHETDTLAEEITKKWLEKKRFKIEDWHKNKRSNKPYDILAVKNGKRWAIEVKTGSAPQVKVKNFKQMINRKNIDMFGLVLVIDKCPYLLSYNKRAHSGETAWTNKRKIDKWWSKEYNIHSKKE